MLSIFFFQLAALEDDLRHTEVVIVVQMSLRAGPLLEKSAHLLSHLFVNLKNRSGGRRLLRSLFAPIAENKSRLEIIIPESEIKAMVEMWRHFWRFVRHGGRA